MNALELREKYPWYQALAHLRTPDESARRRNRYNDEDERLVLFGSPYFYDATAKIALSKSFRRAFSKTQVFKDLNLHVRNRASHSQEVAHVAVMLCRLLGLNEQLAYAGGLAHDLGHVPLGHAGEKFLSKVLGVPFRHEVFGVVVLDQIERCPRGLNLCREVLECVRWHSRGKGEVKSLSSVSAEANAVMLADKTYLFADMNDARLRSGNPDIQTVIQEIDDQAMWFGVTQRARVEKFLIAVCEESADIGAVCFEKSEAAERFNALKDRMYREIYPFINYQNSDFTLSRVYDGISKLPIAKEIPPALIIALMTDADVLYLNGVHRILPEHLNRCSVYELFPRLRGQQFDMCTADLDW